MIITAHESHVGLITRALPPAGITELAEVYRMTPEEAMRRNLASSTEAWTMFCGTEALAMFGVAPLSIMERRGEFWIAGTTHICQHRIAFGRMCRKFLPTLLANWDRLDGVLEHGRPEVVKWAQWLGTKITPLDTRLSTMQLGVS